MTPFPDCPTPEQAQRAAEMMFKVAGALADIAYGGGSWNSATGHLQDALAELGFDLRPLNPPAPATAEAYGPHDYAASVGGM